MAQRKQVTPKKCATCGHDHAGGTCAVLAVKQVFGTGPCGCPLHGESPRKMTAREREAFKLGWFAARSTMVNGNWKNWLEPLPTTWAEAERQAKP